MSTRSGKRIHGSFHENIAEPDDDFIVKSERKTRSRRLKENRDELTVPRSKKRHNYVSYPADDEPSDNTTKIQKDGEISAKPSKITLKEQDLNVSMKTADEIDSGKIGRQTRRNKKLSENIPEDILVAEIENVKSKKKIKKNKKKKVVTEVDINENEGVLLVQKKSKKRKGKTSDTVAATPEVITTEHLNKSNGSIDSFHSAAGSPTNDVFNKEVVKLNGSFKKSPRRASKRSKADSYGDINGEASTQNDTFDKSSKKIKLSNYDDKLEMSIRLLRSDDKPDKKKDETIDMPNELSTVLNTTFEKEPKRKRKTSIKNSTFDKIDEEIKELHSSSEKIDTPNKLVKAFEEEKKERKKSLRSTYDKSNTSVKEVDEINSTYEKTDTSNKINVTFDGDKSRRKSLRSTYDKTDTPLKDVEKLNSTYEKDDTPSKVKRTTVDNNVCRKSLRSTFDKIDTLSKNSNEQNSSFTKANTPSKSNNTLEAGNRSRRMSLRLSLSVDKQAEKELLDTTFENSKAALDTPENSKLNSTFDKSKDSHQSTVNATFEKSKDSRQSTINTTFEKSKDSKQSTLNSTFDKETQLNSTYDKQNEQDSDGKSSIISSDSASNLTFDKSDDMSRISITSDDSRTENIVNTTPVLIESSMDESRVLDTSPKDVSQSSDDTKLKPSVTPLKREGTFTKDSPDIVSMSPRVNVSLNNTPVKRMSLPSPGSTPFPFSKSAQKEMVMMNVTRSIEKSVRRSSLVEAAPRQTRVMFCSPVNNPVVVMQQKGKVIKSNLKGSNKSFVFDESASEDVRPPARKRSYTASEAERALAKRTRLGDQRHSVARLSRPRTASVTVKLSEPSTPSKTLTPIKKAPTPSNAKSEAKVGRTKLPNFAALHQKQFSRMESLDECQVRRARRARQLLTPTGALAIIEKSSPKGKATATTAESTKAAKEVTKKSDVKVSKKTEAEAPKKTVTEIPKKTETEVSKTETPSKAPKAFTLDSLRPGYTRFGFKMNLDVNPFSIPPKADAKPKETKPNGLVRQLTKPSLAGATTGRREVAKQIVMRERSFTSLSDKRKEKRTMIKGVRTNRRFELQMKLRNINS